LSILYVHAYGTYQRKNHAEEDESAAGEAGHEQEGGGEHAHQRDTNILVQLLTNHLHKYSGMRLASHKDITIRESSLITYV
jgi:hypothetical protein